MDKGYHRILYRFSPEDYTELDKIWNGPQVDDGGEREVVDEPPEGGPMPDNPELPTEFAPGVSAEDVAEIARKIGAQ
jgi:Mn-containing catalase